MNINLIKKKKGKKIIISRFKQQYELEIKLLKEDLAYSSHSAEMEKEKCVKLLKDEI